MNDVEFQRELSRLTVKGATAFLIVLAVVALICFLLWLREQRRKEANRHAEALMAAEASRDIGCTAWHVTDVHKDKLIQQQAAEIRELRGWKKRTEKRLASIGLAHIAKEA